MAEYEREFFRLSHYAISLLSTSRERCKRFETCLKLSIRLQVVGFKHTNFSELICQALELEKIESEATPEKKKLEKIEKEGKSVEQSSSGPTGKRKNHGGHNRGGKKSGGGRYSGQKPPLSG